MNLTNFRFETDADGVALVTWDMPGRSMNVLTPEVIEELERHRRQGRRRRRDQGRRLHLGQGGFSGGADLTMLQGWRTEYARVAKAEGEEAAMRVFFDRSRQLSLIYRKLETCGKPFAAAINGVCMGGALRAGARLPLSHRRRYRQGARRPAGDQGRPVPRRRRHAARRAADADARRAADAVQGRSAQARRGQEDGPRPRRRACRARSSRAPRTG